MEFLKEVLDEELYSQVAEKLKDTDIKLVDLSKGEYVGKGKFDTLNETVTVLKGQLKNRDAQLKKLEGVDAEGLQAEIAKLQEANKQTTKDFEAKLQQQAFDHAVDNAITGTKAKNTKALRGLLDFESIKMEDGELTGFDEQVTAIKESDSYLFEVGDTGGAGNPAGGGKPDSEKELEQAMADYKLNPTIANMSKVTRLRAIAQNKEE